MTNKTSNTDRQKLPSRESRIRHRVIVLVVLGSMVAWNLGMVITHLLSPFGTTALAVVSAIGAVWIALCFLSYKQSPKTGQRQSKLGGFTAAFMFFSVFVLTLENLFGQQTALLLSDKIPSAAFGYCFAILIAFCLLTVRQAIWTSSLFTLSLMLMLMLMLALHFYLYLDQYNSFYAVGVLAGVIFMLCPVNIALLYGFHRVMHAEIELADRQIEQSTFAFRQAAISAKKDSLTGVFNRFGMWEALDRAYANTPRLGIITVKLSNESQLNDYLGGRWMDQLYRDMARTLGNCSEKQSAYARREGGEFVLWYAELKDNNELEKTGDNILKALNKMSAKNWKGKPEFRGAGRFCSDHKPPSRILEETQFLIQFGKSTNIAFSTL